MIISALFFFLLFSYMHEHFFWIINGFQIIPWMNYYQVNILYELHKHFHTKLNVNKYLGLILFCN